MDVAHNFYPHTTPKMQTAGWLQLLSAYNTENADSRLASL
jgi:hypothetical protein